MTELGYLELEEDVATFASDMWIELGRELAVEEEERAIEAAALAADEEARREAERGGRPPPILHHVDDEPHPSVLLPDNFLKRLLALIGSKHVPKGASNPPPLLVSRLVDLLPTSAASCQTSCREREAIRTEAVLAALDKVLPSTLAPHAQTILAAFRYHVSCGDKRRRMH